MTDKIRVLIFDDQQIVREGLQHLLARASDIQVNAIAEAPDEVLPKAMRARPDVLVLDMDWEGDMGSSMAQIISQLKQKMPQVPIIALSAFAAGRLNASAVSPTYWRSKSIRHDELIGLIRRCYWQTVSENPEDTALDKSLASMARIRARETDTEHAEHEKDIGAVLEVLFYPYLVNPDYRSRTEDGTQIRDIVFSNSGGHPFWLKALTLLRASQVVFEVKNKDGIKVTTADCRQVLDYLEPQLGHLGFLVTRTRVEPRSEFRLERKVLTEQKIVLCLCDDDLNDLLDCYIAGKDPSDIVNRRYDDLVRNA